MRHSVVIFLVVGCGEVPAEKPDAATKPVDAAIGDAAIGTDAPADVMVDVPAGALGSMQNPGESCVALRNAGLGTGVYWLRNTTANPAAFQTYCDQTRNGGGWALVYRSYISQTGDTILFWQMTKAQRFDHKGDPNPTKNFYAGSLYKVGREYMDTITDTQNKTVVGFAATTTGIVETTMVFQSPIFVSGDSQIFGSQFASGWSAKDYDGDPFGGNCADIGGGIMQHYTSCFVYSLGADGDEPHDDGGTGPHVLNGALNYLSLAVQSDGGTYSRVNAIERYARW